MGKVYAAEHVLMRKRRAVKVLHRELTLVPEVVARFEREAMAAANIEHPNVASATDFGKLPDGAVFLVLEFVSGRSLRDEIANGPFAIDRALHVARQIAAALGAAHLQGIVHRDLKPENVMLVEKAGDPDFVKVLDFGIAKVPIGEVPAGTKPGNPITKAGMVFGTPEYMSPEQALGQNVDGRADLYALGVILFEMVSGVRPFTSQSSVGILGQQLSKPPPTFLERSPGLIVPPSVEQIVHKLLQREAAERFASANDVVQAIDVLLAPLPGQGAYRYTLADGSPPSVRGSNPSYPELAAPIEIDYGQMPQFSPVPGMASSPELSSARAADVAGRAFSAVEHTFESSRAHWPAPLRDWLRHVRTRVLLLLSAGFALLLTVLGVALCLAIVHALHKKSTAPTALATSSASAAEPAPSAPPKTNGASDAELGDAVKSGIPALEALSTKYPQDARPVLELGRAEIAARDYVKAVGYVGRALNLDPTLADSKQVASILFQTAQVKGATDASFALLFGPMGKHGPDIAYDLAATEVVKPWVRARADQWLRTPDFNRLSSPELAVAVALRFAVGCQQKYGLLLRAKDAGDERALGYINQYKNTTGCGGRRHRDDCYACMRGDSRLKDTIDAINARVHASAAPADSSAPK